MRLAPILICAALTAVLTGASSAQTVQPGSQQPPVATPQQPPSVRVQPVQPANPALRGVTLRQSIRTSALTMVGGALAVTSAAPRTIRTTNLTMIGGAMTSTSVAPRNIRTTTLGMRGAP